jgi:transcriptional regulator with PAS, ATPase and Fis domain
MGKEAAESWLRSRDLGINPYMKVNLPSLSVEEHQTIVDKNRRLIEITRPLVNNFKDMAILTSGYVIYLCDKKGAFLLQEGELQRIPTEHDSKIRTVWNESTIGTNIHSLCMRLRRPIQLMGPEHYCVVLQDIIASASPIMDESGEIIATLILSQPLIDRPWVDSFQNFRSHTLGLITSLAAAVEAQIKLEKSNEKLKESYDDLATVHNTLEATLAFIDEGIITIDRSGKIIHINQEGMRALKLRPEDIGTKNIGEFLNSQSQLLSLAQEGKNVTIDETICSGNDEQAYVVSIQPILNQTSKQVDTSILRLNLAEKINALVASRSGANASYKFEDILGENKEFKKSLAIAQRFANSPENILLLGESGTGKELFAQAIHNIYRPQGPFIAVNCAAMPRELIESELFGYEGGSFTGAERSGKPGKIELANGGTLFLDEIGDMPLELQAVLLRTLEDKQIMRIGGRRYKKVDFRLVAATNKNLYKMFQENQFREDLYFRLSVLTINIPPLRERGNDVEILSKIFIEKYCQKQGWKVPQISQATQTYINEYQWPGNVRQLQNAMVFAVNTVQDDIIKPENLPNYIILDTAPIKIDPTTNSIGDISEMLCLENLEKSAIGTALLHANNCVPVAAEILGISRSTLYRKLKYYNIEHEQ